MLVNFLVSRQRGELWRYSKDGKKIITHQYKRPKTGCIKATARSTIGTANGFTLMKTKYRDAMDGYCFGSAETQKEWGSEILNFKSLSVWAGGNVRVQSRERRTDRTQSFPAKNLIGLSCRHRLVFCVSSRSQIGSPTNSTCTILTLYSKVKDHMELVFTAVKCNKQILWPHELYLGCCRYIMIEAESHLKLCPASIWDMYKVFEHIDMMSIGIWHTVYQPYTVIPTLLG